MNINLRVPGTSYSANFDPGVMDTVVTEAYCGVGFIADGSPGEELSVAMRDGGFEVMYRPDNPDGQIQYWTFVGGIVRQTA